MRRVEVRTEDELNRTVLIRLQPDKTIAVSLEERDANELVLVLRGYHHLVTNQNLPVDKEESPPVEDLAPPFLSQHKVVPEKWSYIAQNQLKTVCFAMHPVYQNLNRKTNGLYNTVGRQSHCKTPLMLGFSLDSNMNSSMSSNKNHARNNSYDSQIEGGIVEARNEEVLRRVAEMQFVVESSEKYLTEQELLAKSNEWQETSVDIESDTDSALCGDEDGLGQLKHSDSLLLLTKSCELRNSFANAAVEMLRSESNQSESDNDSLYTPHDSPIRKEACNNHNNNNNNNKSRVSFGLHSPDTGISESQDLKLYLARLRVNNKANGSDMYVFDPDIIDLTMLPPPVTPDELDCNLPPINVPPSSFADSMDKLHKLGVLHENLDLEEFLASVTVPPPTQKVTPAVELTPEEIMSYIIPPPPEPNAQFDSLTGAGRPRSNTTCTTSSVIEYATVDSRKGAFSCCALSATKNAQIQPLPRRSSDEKPPERPPKNSNQERQRSQSLSSQPPKLPPKGEAPPHLFLPPKKPPLPPVPPLEALRGARKAVAPPVKSAGEPRTACIGSPHLQRSRNTNYNELGRAEDGRHSTAISTPTSPHLGSDISCRALELRSGSFLFVGVHCVQGSAGITNVGHHFGISIKAMKIRISVANWPPKRITKVIFDLYCTISKILKQNGVRKHYF